jgi:parallel beta-helix repeat protein
MRNVLACGGPALAAAWLLALAPLAAPPARAETSACTVLTLPATISAPGVYCLQQDFVQSFGFDTPVSITADDVVLDCNHRRIKDTDAATTRNAIVGENALEHVTNRNCVLDGWYVGIFLQAGSDPGSNGNRILDNTILRSRLAGIWVIGSNNLIEGNRVSQNTANYGGTAYGIYVYSAEYNGVGNAIRRNIVSDFKPTPPGDDLTVTAIGINNMRNTDVSGNVISGIYATEGHAVGAIVGYNVSATTVNDNIILGPRVPGPAPWTGSNSNAIALGGTPEDVASNVCRGNIVGHYTVNIYGCTIAESTGF